jgi:hypothetical protein
MNKEARAAELDTLSEQGLARALSRAYDMESDTGRKNGHPRCAHSEKQGGGAACVVQLLQAEDFNSQCAIITDRNAFPHMMIIVD